MTGSQWKLTEEELREIEKLRTELGNQFCRRCDYCQPCIMEIPISTVLNIRNLAHELPSDDFFNGTLAEAIEKAEGCNECGDCEERCPFQLPIREKLAEEVKWYQEEKVKHQEQVTS